MKVLYKEAFLKAFQRLDRAEQELVCKSDVLIREYLKTLKAPFGLRIKRLSSGVYEARSSDRLRIVWIQGEDSVSFALLGNHEEVRRFIRRL